MLGKRPKRRLTDAQLKDLADLLARTKDCRDYIQRERLACTQEWLDKRRSELQSVSLARAQEWLDKERS